MFKEICEKKARFTLTQRPSLIQGHYYRLLQEVTALKAAAFVGGNEAAQHDLCSLLDIMTACISALHEQRHSSLISEIFSISMWDAVKVWP